MERNRKQKLLIILVLMAGIASLSIGFAAFSTTLNISTSATVTSNSDTFSVKFSTSQNSLVVGAITPSSKTSGITASEGVIDNGTNPTIKNLSATFTNPGQYVEYTFYARNEGEYTAYLNSINFIGEKTCTGNGDATKSLVQNACETINITATIGSTTYTETTPITGHTLNKKTGEQIKVRLEYASNGTYVDGSFTIEFPDLALVYSTLDDSNIQPSLTKVAKLESGDLNTQGSIVSIGNEQFYVLGQEDEMVKLLTMYNLYVGNSVDKNSEVTPLANPTGIQDPSARGFLEGQYPWVGTVEYSLPDSTKETHSNYNGSIVEGYVNNYKLYLEGLGANIQEARIISEAELETFGCSVDSSSCSEAPNFIYETTYWADGPYGNNSVCVVFSNKEFYPVDYFFNDGFGVRPVIVISQSEF